jgi:hypothetical protein
MVVRSVTSAAIATSARKPVNVRNPYVLLAALLVAALGLGYFVLRSKAPPGWLALVLGLFSVWMVLLELRGVSVAADAVSFPRRPFRWLPILSVWRRRVPLRDLDEMTVLRPWCGLQVVLLEGRFGAERVLFHSRKARLAFFETVKANLPDVRIYRTQ